MPKQVKKSLVLSIYFALAVSTLLVFWQVWNFDFANYDDNVYVFENQRVLNGITGDGAIWAFTTGYASNWHPLTWLSLMLDCQLFGLSPGMMHLVNVFFHLANTLLLFAVLKKMTGSLWPSAFVAALFALHPMHVESVAWIPERKDVLSTFFLLLTLAAFTGYVSRPSILRYVTALVAFALGLMAKPMLVTLPFLLLLLDYWPLNRFAAPRTVKTAGGKSRKPSLISDRRRVLYRIIVEKVPFLAIAAISSVVTFLIQRNSGAMAPIDDLLLKDRVANAFLSYARYIGKMFWPQNLAAFYPFDADSFAFWQVAMCVLLLLVISIFVIRFGRNQKYLPVGWFWFVGTLVPVIGIVQAGSQAYADRYTYIPYIGLFLMLAWSLQQLLSKWPQRKITLGFSMVLVLTPLGICAHRQVGFWKDGITLFSHAARVTKDNWFAHNSLGVAYTNISRYSEAVDAYKQAIKIKPYYVDAYLNLGNAYGNLGRYTEAIDTFEQAIKIKPDYDQAYNSLGNAYNKLGRSPEAIDAYQQAIKIKPDYAQAYNNLGFVYGSLRRYHQEIEVYQQAVKIKPDYALAYNNMGAAYVNLGRYAEAIDAYKQAVKIKPDYADAHDNLGYAYLMIGDKNSALAEYNILKSLNTKFADELLRYINK